MAGAARLPPSIFIHVIGLLFRRFDICLPFDIAHGKPAGFDKAFCK